MPKPAGSRIKTAQLAWANTRNISVDKDGYCFRLADNLFQPLTACTRRDFEAGDGAELGPPGGRGKLQALHSSSALACNTFDYWRGRDLTLLGEALGLRERPCSMRLEGQFKTGLRGTPPNLDVVFHGIGGTISGVESKFAEPYSRAAGKNRFKDKYFPVEGKLWGGRGLGSTQQLAEDIHAGRATYNHLDAAQLLKHCLGLAHSGSDWTLIYLWYDPSGEEGSTHRREIERFAEQLHSERDRFGALSYQELFARLGPKLPPEAVAYSEYIQTRYLGTGAGR